MVRLISTVFYIGYLPFMPGTWASIAGCLVWFLLRKDPFTFGVLNILLVLIGIIVSGMHEKNVGKKDPSEIVIDEFVGQMFVFTSIRFDIWTLFLGFILFRFFDIIKVPVIRQLERLPGGFGIMLDDIAAAFFANIILLIWGNMICL